MTAYRRGGSYSLRTLFVVVTVSGIAAFQWSRAERLRHRALMHCFEAISVTDNNMGGGFVPEDEKKAAEQARRREKRKAYSEAASNYHMAMADRYLQAIWQPWVESCAAPAGPLKPEDSPATQVKPDS